MTLLFPTPEHERKFSEKYHLRIQIIQIKERITATTSHHFKELEVECFLRDRLTNADQPLGIKAKTLVWGLYEEQYLLENNLAQTSEKELRFYNEIRLGAGLWGQVYSFDCKEHYTGKQVKVNVVVSAGTDPLTSPGNMLLYMGYYFQNENPQPVQRTVKAPPIASDEVFNLEDDLPF